MAEGAGAGDSALSARRACAPPPARGGPARERLGDLAVAGGVGLPHVGPQLHRLVHLAGVGRADRALGGARGRYSVLRPTRRAVKSRPHDCRERWFDGRKGMGWGGVRRAADLD